MRLLHSSGCFSQKAAGEPVKAEQMSGGSENRHRAAKYKRAPHVTTTFSYAERRKFGDNIAYGSYNWSSISLASNSKMLIIERVFGTSDKERDWHCEVRWKDKLETRVIPVRRARNYVLRQTKAGFPAPLYEIEKSGPMIMHLRGPGRDPKMVYRNCKFFGFSRWEVVPVDTIQNILKQKKKCRAPG